MGKRGTAVAYVQPIEQGSLLRLCNGVCSTGKRLGLHTLEPVRYIKDFERSHSIMRMRARKDLRPCDELVFDYNPSVWCKTAQEALLCRCPRCNTAAAKGKPRNKLFSLAPGYVDECGKCVACQQR